MRSVNCQLRVGALVIAVCCVQRHAQAQLAEWARGFENPGIDGNVYSMVEFDDGSGPALFIGGSFSMAGGVPIRDIARFDGQNWSSVGSGALGPINAMAVLDDGSGLQLYVAGHFPSPVFPYTTSLARWDGSTWHPLPNTNGDVYSLAVFDDGTGPSLYVGGHFLTSGTQAARDVARLSGTAWLPLGPGLGGTSSGDVVRSLVVHDDGAGGGPALYGAGDFSVSGATPVQGLARWDGTSWSGVGLGLDPPSALWSLAEYDDGSGGGVQLYAGGIVYGVGGANLHSVIRWDGSSWTAPGGGVVGSVETLQVFDDGTGPRPKLYAGGSLYQAGGAPANTVASYDGGSWVPSDWTVQFFEHIHALAGFSYGGARYLYAGGYFISGQGVNAESVARLVNGKWIGVGRGNGLDNSVSSLHVRAGGGGQGNHLIAGGRFTIAGTVEAEGIALWNGTHWSPLGGGIDITGFSSYDVRSMADFDDGSGSKLFVAGYFSHAGGIPAFNIASWDGTIWSAVGSGLTPGDARSLAVWNDGTGRALYAGGSFSFAGGVPASNLARWDGSGWSSIGGGINGPVSVLLANHDAAGAYLYAAGVFTQAGSTPVANITRWDGLAWSSVGDPGLSAVNALAFFDDGLGGGSALYAGGLDFTGGANIRRWNGSSWTPVGGGVGAPFDPVNCFLVHDDGTGGGPALYAGGRFDSAGTTSAHFISRWNGLWWEEVAGSVDGPVQAMAEYGMGTGGHLDLIAGGVLRNAGGKPSRYIARLSQDAMAGRAYCYGDGIDPAVLTPCPCLNTGLPNHGCANSYFQGARLAASDWRGNEATLMASNLPPAVLTMLLSASSTSGAGMTFGDGIRCITGSTHRVEIQVPVLNTVRFRARPRVAGASEQYEVLYRNSLGSFCPPALFNVTNAVEVQW